MTLGLSHLFDPDQTLTFMGSMVTVTGLYQPVQIPKSCSAVYVHLLAGGGAGGAGFSRAANNPGGGGAGGGAGGQIIQIIPRILLPDTLYLSIGKGGPSSVNTALHVFPNTDGRYQIGSCVAGGTGGAGSASGGGTGVVVTGTASFGSSRGMIESTNAVTMSASNVGGAHTGANGTNQSTRVVRTTLGASGAGCNSSTNFSGGSVTGNSPYVPDVIGGVSAGEAGGNGSFTMQPFMTTGGAGGASNNSGVGGRGGDGGFGSGGGGGGAGTTGGAGGAGGSSFAMFVWL